MLVRIVNNNGGIICVNDLKKTINGSLTISREEAYSSSELISLRDSGFVKFIDLDEDGNEVKMEESPVEETENNTDIPEESVGEAADSDTNYVEHEETSKKDDDEKVYMYAQDKEEESGKSFVRGVVGPSEAHPLNMPEYKSTSNNKDIVVDGVELLDITQEKVETTNVDGVEVVKPSVDTDTEDIAEAFITPEEI